MVAWVELRRQDTRPRNFKQEDQALKAPYGVLSRREKKGQESISEYNDSTQYVACGLAFPLPLQGKTHLLCVTQAEAWAKLS